MTETPHSSGDAEPRRRRRILPRVLFASVATVLLLEVTLRALLFVPAMRGAGERLRDPASFAHRWTDDYWKLKYTFAGPTERLAARHDPITGWLHERIESGSYDHRARASIEGKRPILLYGDSYSACVTSEEECWEGLLAASEFADEYAMLNYGVSGFGFDQMYLLFQQSIDHYAHLNPVVIIGILVDKDLDRATLRFRGWPKPLLEIDGEGGLRPEGPVVGGTEAFLEEHPLAVTSYAWRFLLNGTRLVPSSLRHRWTGEVQAAERARGLGTAILEAFQRDLDERGLEYFVVIFHGRKQIRDDPQVTWHEEYFVRELERLGIPWVGSQSLLVEDRANTGRDVWDYFVREGVGARHYNALGNSVVFEAFRRGLLGQFDSR